MTRVIRLELDSARLDNGRDFARFVRLALAPIVTLNIIARREGRVPSLYRSGVRFMPEPEFPERFRDAENVFRTGFGDCAQLAAWRVADHIHAGQEARVAVVRGLKRIRKRGRWVRPFHVVVRLPDGRLEDPSLVCGA